MRVLVTYTLLGFLALCLALVPFVLVYAALGLNAFLALILLVLTGLLLVTISASIGFAIYAFRHDRDYWR